MTLPNVDRDWLIFAVSLSLSLESIPVFATHSLPARSTKCMTLYFILVWDGDIWIFCTKFIDTIVWDLELLSFINVAAIERLFDPYSIFLAICSYECTGCLYRPSTYTPNFFDSQIFSYFFLFFWSKSRTVSLYISNMLIITSNCLVLSVFFYIFLKISSQTMGITPRLGPYPIIEYDFPEPVCP